MPDAINLVSAPGYALWLQSTAGLPVSVEVRAGAANPWLGGCPTVTVEAWASGTSRMLDSKTFRLRDPWSWCGLSCEPELDCVNTTVLLLQGHTGPVTFVLKDDDGAEVGRSAPVPLAEVPPPDDDPPWWNPGGGGGTGTLGDIASLVKWGVIGAVVVAGFPLLKDTFDSFRR